jgi:hypothetical protein
MTRVVVKIVKARRTMTTTPGRLTGAPTAWSMTYRSEMPIPNRIVSA